MINDRTGEKNRQAEILRDVDERKEGRSRRVRQTRGKTRGRAGRGRDEE